MAMVMRGWFRQDDYPQNEILYKGTAARVMRGSKARAGAHGGIDG